MKIEEVTEGKIMGGQSTGKRSSKNQEGESDPVYHIMIMIPLLFQEWKGGDGDLMSLTKNITPVCENKDWQVLELLLPLYVFQRRHPR